MTWCIQCKQDRPDDQFLKIAKRGYRVVKCNACASENVRKWARKVNMNPNSVAESDE